MVQNTNPMQTILVVDDKANIVNLLKDYLSERGFRPVTASNGREALFVARHEKPDLVLLDIMMPEMDGFTFMRAFRKESQAPVIILTAKMEEHDKVLGLELGADDYITKPFGMSELVARIRAVLRRTGTMPETPDILRFADITIDRSKYSAMVGNQTVSLTPSEFELLTTLVSTPGRVYSRAQLLEILQGNSLEGSERTIDVHIRNLRSKIEPDASRPKYIKTVFGVGYSFDVDEKTDT